MCIAQSLSCPVVRIHLFFKGLNHTNTSIHKPINLYPWTSKLLKMHSGPNVTGATLTNLVLHQTQYTASYRVAAPKVYTMWHTCLLITNNDIHPFDLCAHVQQRIRNPVMYAPTPGKHTLEYNVNENTSKSRTIQFCIRHIHF